MWNGASFEILAWSLPGFWVEKKKSHLVNFSKFLWWGWFDWREERLVKQKAEVHCVTLTFRMAQLLFSTETKSFICLGWGFVCLFIVIIINQILFSAGITLNPSIFLPGQETPVYHDVEVPSLDMLENLQTCVVPSLPLLKMVACGSWLTLRTNPELSLQ